MLDSKNATQRRIEREEANGHYHRFNHPSDHRYWVKVMPGGVYATGEQEIIHTGLGSCVSVCAWDTELGIGGMNHFLLPFNSQFESQHWHPQALLSDASRYGCYAMELLINRLLSMNAERERLHFKLFGGAHLLGYQSQVGEKNVEFVLEYAKREKLHVVAQDLGGSQPRKLLFDPKTGQAWIKRIGFSAAHAIKQDEEHYQHKIDKQSPYNDVELFQ
ncbi:chemotaxis protein CheD [Vibrio metoecus]|uniref:Probable chemoreceptor glutamine deamidase CheD n=1 Tax=Vibrio metoecus TaxID=1481663 RepID=A0ABR4RYV1_VIBMT|nr:chemotaxis protein CheD [Vibrio metoecus]